MIPLDYPLTWKVLFGAVLVALCVIEAHFDRICLALGLAVALIDHLLNGSSPRDSTHAAQGVDPWGLETYEERLWWLVDDVDDPRFQRGA